MNCSICIYTRRPKRLLETISSCARTADEPKNIEFMLRYDRDDGQMISMRKEIFDQHENITMVSGDTLGYSGYTVALWEMYQKTTGDWLWHFDDDATMEECSQGWDTKLKLIKQQGVVVLPEIDHLGGSRYQRNSIHPFMWLRNKWWEQIGLKEINASHQPFDDFIFKRVQPRHKWPTVYLDGVSTWHQRIKEDELNLMQQRF